MNKAILQREEEEAAKLYEDFVESFGDKDEETGKSFVQGETIQPGSSQTAGGSQFQLWTS